MENRRCIAIIGAGGKSTSMQTLASQYACRRVLMTTTTHVGREELRDCRILLQDPEAEELMSSLRKPGIVGAGRITAEGKFCGLREDLLEKAAEMAEVTLIEADGAKRMPLKLHNEREPVIPDYADTCLIVAGLSALGRPIREGIHRYSLYPEWEPEQTVGPSEVLFCIREAVSRVPEGIKIRILLNQADTVQDPRQIDWILDRLREKKLSCREGSLRENPRIFENWI